MEGAYGTRVAVGGGNVNDGLRCSEKTRRRAAGAALLARHGEFVFAVVAVVDGGGARVGRVKGVAGSVVRVGGDWARGFQSQLAGVGRRGRWKEGFFREEGERGGVRRGCEGVQLFCFDQLQLCEGVPLF